MSDILSIIVTYHPNINFLLEMINAINAESDIAIIDNGSLSKNSASLVKIMEDIEYFKILDTNYGIGYAQNLGINFAITKNYKYIVLLDQDSAIDCNIIVNLKKRLLYFEENNSVRIASISAAPIQSSKFIAYSTKNISYANLLNTSNIFNVTSSGTLIPVDCLQKIGLMNENLFIDLVDYEWGWRAHNLGFNSLICNDISFSHKFGEEHKIFYYINLNFSTPIRNYYQYRNSIILINSKVPPLKWKILIATKMIIKIPFLLLLGNHRLLRLKYLLAGIYDGFIGKSGRYY